MPKDFFSKEAILQALASYDEEEAKMSASLAHLAEHGPARTYRFLKREYARSLAQINVRRKMLKRILPQVENVKPII